MLLTRIILYTKPISLKFCKNDNVHRYRKLYFMKHLIPSRIRYYSTKEDENVIYKIDPKVKAVQDKIIYSEYLSYEKVVLGYLKRLKLKKKAKQMSIKQYEMDQLNETVYSVLLDSDSSNNSTDSIINKEATEFCNLSNNESDTTINMPYASTDKFELINRPTDETTDISKNNNTETSEFSLLNEDYKDLYNKYLETKSLIKDEEKLNFIEYEEAHTEEELDNLQDVPDNWMEDYEQYDESQNPSDWLYGTPNKNTNISHVPCGGCGALLHCKDHALPGYLPSELFIGRTNEELKIMICQRCHFMKYYKTALEVKVSPEDYPELLKVIKTRKCAVILMIDLTDFPCSIWPNIGSILHPRTSVFVVGNKIDLLPQDVGNFETHVKECVSQAIENAGVKKANINHIALISARTGYGVEELINKLHKLWKYKGNVYLIGCTNVGKSSLFNRLLDSDYCKVQALDLVQRATISPWPGTTLNLLKFPITNPLKWRLYLRAQRLHIEQKEKHAETLIRRHQFNESRNIKYAELQGYIGKTFVQTKVNPKTKAFYAQDTPQFGLDETHPDFKDGRWCYDTPGTIQSDQILDILTTEELIATLPHCIISPRTFVVQPGQTIFIGGLGRFDYLEGNTFIRCTIFASNKLPITMCHVINADDLYKELLHTEAFSVPINNPKRLEVWPSLKPKQMEVTGINNTESAADVILSNAGWIAVTPDTNERIKIQGWTPSGRGIYLRIPALLKKSVTLRGARILGTPAYNKGKRVYTKC